MNSSTVIDRPPAHRSRHRQIFETLQGDIASGRIQPGDRLPPEAELARTFSASRSTVARAVRDLKTNGLLHQRRCSTPIAEDGGKRIALFTPFADSASDLGFMGGEIYRHLSELASGKADHLRLQLLGRVSGDRLQQMLNGARTLVEHGVAGVFYYPVELPAAASRYNQLVVDRLLAAGIAVVCVDRDISAFPHRSGLPVVTYDNRRGGYLVTEHLIRQGSRRIAFIGSPSACDSASARLGGYRDALDDHELELDKSLIRSSSLDKLDTLFCKTLMEDGRPDAIVCTNDHYAAVVERHLSGTGWTIGRDVLLAGFDDDPIAQLLPVPLTTIRFPTSPFARVCYDRLMSQMGNTPVPSPGTTLIDVELVIRSSSGGASV